MLGRVEEANGDQILTNNAKPVTLVVETPINACQARRSDGWLERIDETFLLFTLVKSPSKIQLKASRDRSFSELDRATRN